MTGSLLTASDWKVTRFFVYSQGTGGTHCPAIETIPSEFGLDSFSVMAPVPND